MNIKSLLSKLIKTNSRLLHELWSILSKPIESLASIYINILKDISRILKSITNLKAPTFTPRVEVVSPQLLKESIKTEPVEEVIKSLSLQPYISYTVNIIKEAKPINKPTAETIRQQPLSIVALSNVLAESMLPTFTLTQAMDGYLSVSSYLQAPQRILEALSQSIPYVFKPVIHEVSSIGLGRLPIPTITSSEISPIFEKIQSTWMFPVTKTIEYPVSYLAPLAAILLTDIYIIETLKHIAPYQAYPVAPSIIETLKRMDGYLSVSSYLQAPQRILEALSQSIPYVFKPVIHEVSSIGLGRLPIPTITSSEISPIFEKIQSIILHPYETMKLPHFLIYSQPFELFKLPRSPLKTLPVESLHAFYPLVINIPYLSMGAPPSGFLIDALKIIGNFQILGTSYVGMLPLINLVRDKYMEAFSKAELVEQYVTLLSTISGLRFYSVLRSMLQLRPYNMVESILMRDMYIVRGEELSPLTTMTIESLRSIRSFKLAEEEARREILNTSTILEFPSSTTLRPVIHNIFNITVPEDVGVDLRELERRITQILSEQIRRYYGSLSF